MAAQTGAAILVAGLQHSGIDRVFGVIGMSVMHVMDALYAEKDHIRYISCRHEQVAASMADAHGRLTGTPGVCLLHSGPGALNALIGLTNAAKDCSPVIAVTGSVKTKLSGTNGILEVDHQAIFSPVCKKTFFVSSADRVAEILFEAYRIAMAGPRGPVLIEFPEDMAAAPAQRPGAMETIDVPSPPALPGGVVENVFAEIDRAQRPLILAGGGVVCSGGAEVLQEIAETWQIPVATTAHGRGVLPETHPLCLGRCGFGGGNPVADEGLKQADVILAVGCTLSDLTTYEYTLPISAKIVAVNLDSDNENKRIGIDTVVAADAAVFLSELRSRLGGRAGSKRQGWRAVFDAPAKAWQDLLALGCDEQKVPLSPGYICSELNKLLPDDAIITVGAGTHVLYPMAYIPRRHPLTYFSAANFGAMGFGFPAAMALKLASPERTVVNISGDGDFMMTVQDLETAVRENIPVKVLVLNDNAYRVLYLRQKFLFEGRFLGTRHQNPDFVQLAAAFGAAGFRMERPSEVASILEKMLEAPGPVVVEAVIDPDDMGPTNLEAVFNMG